MASMAGHKIRYKVQYEDGTIRTVTAQSYQGAKDVFICRFQPPAGTRIVVWPDKKDADDVGLPDKKREKRRMRVGGPLKRKALKRTNAQIAK